MFSEINIMNGAGEYIGKIRRRFTIVNKKFDVFDSYNEQIYRIIGPLFRPWTFRILKGGSEIGRISKKWSGFAKEAFTKADNFNVTFLPETAVQHKYLFLGALFLIDMKYFER